MKLIDILVEELPKRDGWPAKASHAVYAKRFSRVFFTVGGAPAITGDDVSIFEDYGAGRGAFWLPGVMLNCEEPVDYATAIITREQYEAALAAKNDDWIEWGGGRCPVDDVTEVDIKFRTGGIAYGVEAGKYYWPRTGQEYDIIAYRLHHPQEVEQAEADDEVDLSERIGQDAAPVWNGEGVTPPVGCVCERSWAGDEWQRCKILFTSNQLVVVKLKGSGREDAYNIGDVTFRPIRSESNRKRDIAVGKIFDVICKSLTDESESTSFAIYDAIAAGEIPGVRLED